MRLALAVDLEHRDDAARLVSLAITWAGSTSSILDLLYAEGTHATTGWIRDPAAKKLVELELERMRHGSAAALTALLDRVPEGQRGVARVLEGTPVAALVAAAEGYDALLVATHGRRGLAHFWLGSVAEQLVRRASVPVVVLRLPAPA